MRPSPVEEVTLRARPRPDAATRVVDRVKLHRRAMPLDGRTYTVITPRPGTDIRFSTNYFHGTWHLLSDWHGARMLGRLLWGMAFQRKPGTLLLIDRPFLDPNPFDAEPADPIALVPALLTPLRAGAARELRRRLPLSGPSDGTVSWRTHGLTDAIAAEHAWRSRLPGGWRPPWIRPTGFQMRIDRIGGLLVWAATPSVFKDYAMYVYQLGRYAHRGMAYAEVDWPHGEVQVFADYRRRVNAARTARREILAEHNTAGNRADLIPLIWQRGTLVRQRRLPAINDPAEQ
jgi:hypothetical protein